MEKTYFNWSSGKDSSLALYHILQQGKCRVDTLITTINEDYERVSMHGLREELLDRQVQSMGFSLEKIKLPAQVSMTLYNEVMQKTVDTLKRKGYTHCVFGDIFLEDLRKYREEQLSAIGIQSIFPLWKRDTKELYLEFIRLGFKAITVCVNAKYLDESFCGRILDEEFLNDLPENVDPCGEHGEFHTFVYDGPIFKKPVEFQIGEKVHRSYEPSKDENDTCFTKDKEKTWDTSFWYCDLVPE